MRFVRPFALFLTLVAAAPVAAAPRDELLRLAPPDAALLLLVQNGRDRVEQLERSPFAKWLPESALGRKLLSGGDLKQVRVGLEPIFNALGVTPEALLADVFGDAVAFAYSPAANDDPAGERAVVLIRPRKPETLAKLVEKLNAIQIAGGEVKAVATRKHRELEYFERQKADGASDYYCFRGGVFAFSSNRADIQAVIERDAADAKPILAEKLAKLGISESFAIALVNPRPLDRELAAKVAAAPPAEKAILERFRQVWLALDSAAIDLAIGSDVELGVSIQFLPGKAPAFAEGWLTGPRTGSSLWQAIPAESLFAVAGHLRAAEVIEALQSLAPPTEPNSVKTAIEQTFGPVVGKDKLPHVLNALGPNWAVWAEPPGRSGFLPVVVGVVQIDVSGPNGKDAARALARSIGYGFNAARVGWNAAHTDQIEVIETEENGATITSLKNEKGFPPGFQPAYAFKGGYLVLASSPEAIRRFQAPKPATPSSEAVFARVSAVALRTYLQNHGRPLVQFLAAAGHGDEAELTRQFATFADVLELFDRVELAARGSDTGLRLIARFRLAKPLK